MVVVVDKATVVAAPIYAPACMSLSHMLLRLKVKQYNKKGWFPLFVIYFQKMLVLVR